MPGEDVNSNVKRLPRPNSAHFKTEKYYDSFANADMSFVKMIRIRQFVTEPWNCRSKQQI